MKVIPKSDLITIIEMQDCKLIYESEIEDLFYKFGDDYYKDPGFYSSFKLCKSNADRKALLKGKEVSK